MAIVIEAATKVSDAPANIRSYLGRMSELANVPRNQKKFSNFIKNSLKLHQQSIIDDIWKFLEKLKLEHSKKNDEINENKNFEDTVKVIKVPTPALDVIAEEKNNDSSQIKEKKIKINKDKNLIISVSLKYYIL